jgi:hypothetical protein
MFRPSWPASGDKTMLGGGGGAASGVFYIGCPRCACVEGLLFFLPDVVLYHTVSNLQLSLQAAGMCQNISTLLQLGDRSVYRVSCCWFSPAQSFLVLGPAGLITMFFCLTTVGAVQIPPTGRMVIKLILYE